MFSKKIHTDFILSKRAKLTFLIFNQFYQRLALSHALRLKFHFNFELPQKILKHIEIRSGMGNAYLSLLSLTEL